jgi:hypothetical protein
MNKGITPNLIQIKEFFSGDRRKTDRLPLTLEVLYRIIPSPKWISPVALLDISGGGLKFKSPSRIKKSTELEFKIKIPPESYPIVTKAEVIWCRKVLASNSPKSKEIPSLYIIGTKFYKMNKFDRQRFISYLTENILNIYLNNEGKIKSKKWI